MSLPTNPLLGDAEAVAGGTDHTRARTAFGPTTQLSEMSLGDLSSYLQSQQTVIRSQLPISGRTNTQQVDVLQTGSMVNLAGSGQLTVDGYVNQGVLQMDANGFPSVATTLSGMTLVAPTITTSLTFTGTVNMTGTLTGGTFAGPTLTGTVTIQGATLAGGTGATLSGIVNFTGELRVPSWTTAGRPGTPAAADLGLNTSLLQADLYDGTAWYGLRPRVDSKRIGMAANELAGLSGATGFPVGYTTDPDNALGELGPAANDFRGAYFMVDRVVTATAIGYLVTVASSGALSSGAIGCGLWQVTATGGLTHLQDTGSIGVANTNATGWKAPVLTATQQLLPGVLYAASLQVGTYATTAPKFAAAVAAATAANQQFNVGTPGGLIRNFVVTAQASLRVANTVIGTLTQATSCLLLTVYGT